MPTENKDTLKLPAIRAGMGDWIYYMGAMSFSQIKEYITPDITELHDSEILGEMLQRTITKNYIDIKDYLLGQDERLFNALVLAVYNGAPVWTDSKMTVGGEDFFDIGLLEFNGTETIFPIDGQHRIKGILSAIESKKDIDFLNEQVPVILVAHYEDEKERSRRLFSTLNRRAKAVNIRDIIVLDEDDAAAIITRQLIEKHDLFLGDRIIDNKAKAIPKRNKKAFLSTIALYDCNKEILKDFKDLSTDKKFNDYIKYRPTESELKEFSNFSFLFWNLLSKKFEDIQKFLKESKEINKEFFRNDKTGGSLIFRPIGLLPLIKAIFQLKKRNKTLELEDIMTTLNLINLQLNKVPWSNILWNSVGSKMERAHDKLVILILLYKFQSIHTSSSIKKLSTVELSNLSKMYQERRDRKMTMEEIIKEIS